MRHARTIALRELRAYFNSPLAYVFLAVFVLAIVFVFFNLSLFFSEGQANMRAFFDLVPLMLVILVPALTMRLWAEEAKQGTMETLLTMPVPDWALVVGKFLASWALLGVGLALTLMLPISVSTLGDLDWGPVIGGYLGAMLLGAGYLAVGQFLSATTENQLLAFILSLVVCLVLFLLGWEKFTGILSDRWAAVFRSISTSGRFESVTRGVVDFRDLLYNASLCGFFLFLCVAALRIRRWR